MGKQNVNQEFDEMYDKYKNEFDKVSGGLIETNKADFLKQYVFYTTTIQPVIDKYVEAFLGKRK